MQPGLPWCQPGHLRPSHSHRSQLHTDWPARHAQKRREFTKNGFAKLSALIYDSSCWRERGGKGGLQKEEGCCVQHLAEPRYSDADDMQESTDICNALKRECTSVSMGVIF